MNSCGRLFRTTLRRFWSRWTDVLVIAKTETVIGWRRAGFRLYWRWRSRPRGGRPNITDEIRGLIRRLTSDAVAAITGEELHAFTSSLGRIVATSSLSPSE